MRYHYPAGTKCYVYNGRALSLSIDWEPMITELAVTYTKEDIYYWKAIKELQTNIPVYTSKGYIFNLPKEALPYTLISICNVQ